MEAKDSMSQDTPQDHLSDISQESISSSLLYTSYENLVDLYQGEDDLDVVLDKLAQRTKTDTDWKMHFELLEHLRILNKFHYLALNAKITVFPDFIIQNMDSLRSNLAKQALIFLQEVISNHKTKELPQEFLSIMIPLILDKTTSDKGFIKAEAKRVVKEIETNCAGDAAIVAFSLKSFDKNAAICEFSFQSLCETVKNLGADLQYKLTLGSCKALFRAILKALEGRRAVMKKQGEDLWRHMRSLLEKECIIESFLENKIGLNKQEVSMLSQIKVQRKSAPRPSFQSFIKGQKALMENNMNVDNIPEEVLVSIKPKLSNVRTDENKCMDIVSLGKENIKSEGM